jgi:hypothetical protein
MQHETLVAFHCFAKSICLSVDLSTNLSTDLSETGRLNDYPSDAQIELLGLSSPETITGTVN